LTATHGLDGQCLRCLKHALPEEQEIRVLPQPLGPIEERAHLASKDVKVVYKKRIVAFKGSGPIVKREVFFVPPGAEEPQVEEEESDSASNDLYDPAVDEESEDFVVSDCDSQEEASASEKRPRSPEPSEAEPRPKKQKSLRRRVYQSVSNINNLVADCKFDSETGACQNAFKCLQAAESYLTAITASQQAKKLLGRLD